MHTCVNLKSLCGGKYRISHDESYTAERSEFRSSEEPWLQVIRCRSGHIFPHGGDLLAFSTDRRGSIAGRIRSMPYVDVNQDGDDGITVLFPVSHFDEIAAIVHPRRRRHGRPMTAEEKQRLADMGRESLRRLRGSTSQRCGDDQERAQTAQVDQSTGPNAERENHPRFHRDAAGVSGSPSTLAHAPEQAT